MHIGIGHSLSLICQLTSEDMKLYRQDHQIRPTHEEIAVSHRGRPLKQRIKEVKTAPVRSNFTVFQQLRIQRPKLGTTEEKLPVDSPSSNGLRMRLWLSALDHSHERGRSLVRVSPLAEWDRLAAVQQRRVPSTNINF